jgi:hypothetical protein
VGSTYSEQGQECFVTRDELMELVKFKVELAEIQYLQELLEPVSALRAVVELHKPVIHALPDETCLACQDLYPCPTIRVIEKELNAESIA